MISLESRVGQVVHSTRDSESEIRLGNSLAGPGFACDHGHSITLHLAFPFSAEPALDGCRKQNVGAGKRLLAL